MKSFSILFCLLCFCTTVAKAQFVTNYYQVYRVLDANERPISNSPYIDAPVMMQMGGSQYTGYNAYVNLANLGNLIYNMTLDRTSDGYYIYAMPSIGGGYSLYDLYGKPYYLMSSPQGNQIIFASNGNIYYARSIGKDRYMQLTRKLIEQNPDFYRSISPGRSSGSSREKSQRSSGSQTCTHCYGSGKCSSCNGKGYFSNPYTGNDIACPNCERNHNGVCKFCHGRGVR